MIIYNTINLETYNNVTSIIMLDPPSNKSDYTRLITCLSYGQGTLLTLITEKESKEFMSNMEKYAITPLPINDDVIDNFQYRCDDVFRSIKPKQINLEKDKEISKALLKSKKMKDYFKSNEKEREILSKKAYATQFPAWKFKDLHKLPSYLIPQTSVMTNKIEKALQKEHLVAKAIESQVDPYYYETPLLLDADKLEPTSGRKRWMIRHRKGNKKKKTE